MADQIVRLGPEYFPRATSGVPISGGSIFIGLPDTDPEIVGNQIQVSALQENGTTVPISQPILTSGGGVPLYNGAPVTLLVSESYSLKVLDAFGVQIYNVTSISVPVGTTDTTVESVNDLLELIEISTPVDGQTHIMLSFFIGLNKGGGDFFWNSSTDKSTANGGTIVDPDNIGGFDGTTGTLEAFLTAQGGGVGFGCWIREFDGVVNVEWFGSVGDWNGTSGTNDTFPTQKCLDSHNDIVGDLNSVYVIRELLPNSDTTIRDMRISQLIEDFVHAGEFEVLKAVFKMVGVDNVYISNTYVNGNRGSQNLDAAGTDNGGCHAYQIRASTNITLENVQAEFMATDGIAMDPFTSGGVVAPKNIKIINPDISYSRRNNISILGCDGLTITEPYLAQSGQVVAGTESGATQILIGETPWSAPGIDIEPESDWHVKNVNIIDAVFDNCWSGFMVLHSSIKTDSLVSGVNLIRPTFINPTSDKHLALEGGNTETYGIVIKDAKSYWNGFVRLFLGNGVTLDGWESFDSEGVKFSSDFAVAGLQDQTISLGNEITNLNVFNIDIGINGLAISEFGSIASDLQGILFDTSCTVSPTQTNINSATITEGWLSPSRVTKSRTRRIAVFDTNGSTTLETVLYSNENSTPAPLTFDSYKSGFLGWSPGIAFTRNVDTGSSGTTLIITGFASISDVGAVIAFQYNATSQWYHGVITDRVSATEYTIEPAMVAVPDVGQVITVKRLLDAYAIAKQDDIADSTAGDVATITSDFNALLAALRLANLLGDT